MPMLNMKNDDKKNTNQQDSNVAGFQNRVESLEAAYEQVATKVDLEQFATKADLEQFATKVDLEQFATKVDLEQFATKSDLERFATKSDLERFARELIEHNFKMNENLRLEIKEDLKNLDVRFEILNSRFEMLNSRFDNLYLCMIGSLITLTLGTLSMVGFKLFF